MLRNGQSNVVYMNYFIILGLIFLGFVFVFSSNFSDDSAHQIKEHLANSIFARIETGTMELKATSDQTNAIAPIKTLAIPRSMGASDYNIIGKNDSIIIQSAGKSSLYVTKVPQWTNVSFVGASNSQNAEVKLLFNVTSNEIVIS
jgi:hypothetical protein